MQAEKSSVGTFVVQALLAPAHRSTLLSREVQNQGETSWVSGCRHHAIPAREQAAWPDPRGHSSWFFPGTFRTFPFFPAFGDLWDFFWQ